MGPSVTVSSVPQTRGAQQAFAGEEAARALPDFHPLKRRGWVCSAFRGSGSDRSGNIFGFDLLSECKPPLVVHAIKVIIRHLDHTDRSCVIHNLLAAQEWYLLPRLPWDLPIRVARLTHCGQKSQSSPPKAFPATRLNRPSWLRLAS